MDTHLSSQARSGCTPSTRSASARPTSCPAHSRSIRPWYSSEPSQVSRAPASGAAEAAPLLRRRGAARVASALGVPIDARSSHMSRLLLAALALLAALLLPPVAPLPPALAVGAAQFEMARSQLGSARASATNAAAAATASAASDALNSPLPPAALSYSAVSSSRGGSCLAAAMACSKRMLMREGSCGASSASRACMEASQSAPGTQPDQPASDQANSSASAGQRDTSGERVPSSSPTAAAAGVAGCCRRACCCAGGWCRRGPLRRLPLLLSPWSSRRAPVALLVMVMRTLPICSATARTQCVGGPGIGGKGGAAPLTCSERAHAATSAAPVSAVQLPGPQ